jgi:hypothetical protein
MDVIVPLQSKIINKHFTSTEVEKALSFHFKQFVKVTFKKGFFLYKIRMIVFLEPEKLNINRMNVAERTIYTWFNEDFSDTKLSPHPTDYCSECAMMKSLKDNYTVSLSRYRM